jgi:hypothetical protein
MNKVLVSICIAGTALAMSSCRSVEKAMPLSSINGEWNIIEVNGSKVTPGESRTLPFITFDTATVDNFVFVALVLISNFQK